MNCKRNWLYPIQIGESHTILGSGRCSQLLLLLNWPVLFCGKVDGRLYLGDIYILETPMFIHKVGPSSFFAAFIYRSHLSAMRLQLEAEVMMLSQSQAEIRRELTASEIMLDQAKKECGLAWEQAKAAQLQADVATDETRTARSKAGVCCLRALHYYHYLLCVHGFFFQRCKYAFIRESNQAADRRENTSSDTACKCLSSPG